MPNYKIHMLQKQKTHLIQPAYIAYTILSDSYHHVEA